jgi:hypothetical protein
MDDTINDSDHLAWYIVTSVDRWRPLETEIEKCVNALDAAENESARVYEEGYHTGALNEAGGLEEFCERVMDWDVRTAARRYAKQEGLTVPPADRQDHS